MAIDINAVKSVAVVATRLGLKLYDQAGAGLLPLFAQTFQPRTRQQIQYFEWWDAFPLMREWVGDRKVTEVFKGRIDVTVKPFERTFSYSFREEELDGDRSLIQTANDLGQKLSDAFSLGRIHHAFEPLRQNHTTTYDNQNIFDTDHTHLDGATFSNVIDLSDESASRASSGNPTALEARAEIKLAVARLEQNRLRVVKLTQTPDLPPLVIVVKSQGTWSGYYDLLTQDIINNTTNVYKGRFTLLRDWDPKSGDEKKVDVILAEPNGPRPSVFVPVKEPGPLETDTSQYFDTRIVRYGSDAIYGFAAALPHPAVRIQE